MGTITLTIGNSTEEKFRKLVKKKLGGKKGALGEATTQALEFWMHHETQEAIAQDALSILDTGHRFGKRHYAGRKDLYDR